jgi:peptidyl-prolyl cis-trans isomerase B (cyclophilin B)
MMRVLVLVSVLASVLAAATFAAEKPPRVTLETSMGKIVLELDPGKAPETVANFLAYVKDGFYDGTIFHRVIPDFMIQGGGFTSDMQQKSTKAPVKNESKNGLSNARGTISMARTNDPHSATAQFFINSVDNGGLDATGGNWGYAVFGKVVEGIEVVDKISAVKTTKRSGHENVPVEPVVLQKATVAE